MISKVRNLHIDQLTLLVLKIGGNEVDLILKNVML